MVKLNRTAMLSLPGTCVLALLLLAGCGGAHSAALTGALTPAASWPTHGFEGAARSGAFAAVAVDSTERRIDPLTQQLHLDIRAQDGGTLVRILGRNIQGLDHAYLHLKYDSATLHPEMTRSGEWIPADSVFLGITNDPGLVVLGLQTTAAHPRIIGDDVELAAVQFGAGGWQSNRRISTVSASQVTDLHFDTTNTKMLLWSFTCKGDYDQNSEVGISDITPIGIHFHKTPADSTWPAAVTADGDANGEVNLADLQPIGANYHQTLTGYQVKTGATATGPFADEAQVQFNDAAFPIPPAGGYRQFSYVVPAPVDNNFYVVVALSGATEAATLSNPIQYHAGSVTLNPAQNLTAAKVGLAVQLSWQAPTGGTPDGYNCYVDTAPTMTGAVKMNTGNGDVTTLTYNCPLSVDPAGGWYFAIKAVYAGTESAYSNIFAYNISTVGPTNLAASNPATQVHLTWDPVGGTPDGYNAYVGTDISMAGAVLLNTGPIVGTAFDCPVAVDPAVEHFFGVKATTGGNESSYSNIVDYLPAVGGDTTPPVWQQGNGIKAATPDAAGGMVLVTWNVATDAQTPPVQYLLYVEPDGTPIDWSQPADIFASTILQTPVTTTRDGSPLVNGQRYQFVVRAEDAVAPTPNVTTNTLVTFATPQILPPTPTAVPPGNPLVCSDTASVRLQGEEVPRMVAVNHADNLYYVWWNNTLSPPDWTVVDLNLTIGIPGRKYHPQLVGIGDEVHLLFATSDTVYEAYGLKDDPTNWQSKIIASTLAASPGITGSALIYSAAGNYLACLYSGSQGGTEQLFYSDRDLTGNWTPPVSIMNGNPEIWQCDMTIDETTGAQWAVAANGKADSNGDLLKFWYVTRPDRASIWGPATNTTFGGDVMTVDMDYSVNQPVVACAEVRDVDTGFGLQPVSDATIFTWTGNAWGKNVLEQGFCTIDLGAGTIDVGLTGQDPQLIFSPTAKAISLWSNLDFFTDIINDEATLTGDWRYAQRPLTTWSPPQSLLQNITSSNSVTAGESFQHCVTCNLGPSDTGTSQEVADKYSQRNDYAEAGSGTGVGLYYLYKPWS